VRGLSASVDAGGALRCSGAAQAARSLRNDARSTGRLAPYSYIFRVLSPRVFSACLLVLAVSSLVAAAMAPRLMVHLRMILVPKKAAAHSPRSSVAMIRKKAAWKEVRQREAFGKRETPSRTQSA